MVTVPAGSYTMGSPAAEAGRHADEAQRRMTIEDRFAVGDIRSDLRGVGRLRRRRRLGPRPAAGDRRELGRHAGICRVALVKDRARSTAC